MFGSISALFSGLAFAGLIYAILLQKRELGLQREELELTRKELSRTAQAQEASEKALNQQVGSLLLTAKINSLHTLLQAANSKMDIERERSGGLLEKELLDHYKALSFYSKELEKAIAYAEKLIQVPEETLGKN
ncbi:MAG TPA: hypothetical protein VNP04_18570 [Alphaproteobacteria bacterium]|nr:hypothetical protein [Alphaproteobacteria bacterium]